MTDRHIVLFSPDESLAALICGICASKPLVVVRATSLDEAPAGSLLVIDIAFDAAPAILRAANRQGKAGYTICLAAADPWYLTRLAAEWAPDCVISKPASADAVQILIAGYRAG